MKVICIKTHSQSDRNGVIKGKTFHVIQTTKTECCGLVGYDVGVSTLKTKITCVCGHHVENNTGIWWIRASIFAPIQYTSAHDELIESIVEEKADVKIKETVS